MAHASTGHPANTTPSPPSQARAGDIQVQAAETANDAPTAAIPIPQYSDLESGDDLAATLVNDRATSSSPAPRNRWNGLANLSWSAFSGQAVWREAREAREAQEDRSR